MPKTAIDFEALLEYAQTADIANDPLVVDLCAAVVALQERLDDAQIWANANREFFQRPMHWELTRILQDADTVLAAVSDPQRKVGAWGVAMSDYTPTTDEIRERWMNFDGGPDATDAAEFDRWLHAHDAEVREEGAASVDRVDAFVRAINDNGFVLDRGAVRAGLLAAATVSDPQRRNEE